MSYRIGQSTDIHKLVEDRKLILGGVEINHEKGCLAHSDGDVLTHAIIESIIGAMGLGDIGSIFSDEDSKNKDRSSIEMLAEIYTIVKNKSFTIVNIDSLIIIERPKMATHISKMKENISRILEIDESRVNIKATRGEKLGYIGREEGVMAQAVALLKKDESK